MVEKLADAMLPPIVVDRSPATFTVAIVIDDQEASGNDSRIQNVETDLGAVIPIAVEPQEGDVPEFAGMSERFLKPAFVVVNTLHRIAYFSKELF